MNANRIFSLVILMTVTLFLVVTPSIAEAKKDVIKLGAPMSLTGQQANSHEDGKLGMEMAVDEINAAGGVLGKKLEIVYADTKAFSPDAVMNAAMVCERAKVSAAFTSFGGGTIDVITWAKSGIPFFHGNTRQTVVDTFQKLMREEGTGWNAIQMDPTEKAYGMAFEYMSTLLGWKPHNKVAVSVTDDYDYAHAIEKAFLEDCAAAGWEVPHVSRHPLGTTNFEVQMSEIRKINPSICFFNCSLLPTGVAITKEFLRKPTQSLVYVQYTPSDIEYKQLLKEKANGVLWATVLSSLPDSKNGGKTSEFTENFMKRNKGREPGHCYAPALYDWVYAWKAAAEAVGDDRDFRGVCDYITKGKPYEGICGIYDIDPETNSNSAGEHFPNSFYQIQNVKDVLLFLYKENVGQFQLPPWLKETS